MHLGPGCRSPESREPEWPECTAPTPAVLAADADALTLLLEMKLRRRRERPSLPRTVTELVAEDGSRVYVVGTAHFSDDSKRDVVKVGTSPWRASWGLVPSPSSRGRSRCVASEQRGHRGRGGAAG